MKDAWDDLWKNKPTSQGIYFNQLDWEKKVKAEGDRLQEKAAKSDEHYRAMREFQQRNSNQAHQIRDLKKKLEAVRDQVIVPQLKDSKEYLDAHTKPEPHDVVMSRYWLEKGIYGTVYEINKILGDQTSTETRTTTPTMREK